MAKPLDPERILDWFPSGSNLAPCYWPSETEQDRRDLNGELESQAAAMETNKWALTLRYFTNIAYLMGNQYATFLWNASSNSLSYSEVSPQINLPGGLEASIPRTVDNRLVEPYSALISLLTEQKPTPRVTPSSSSPEDSDIAEVGSIVHDLKWKSMRMPFHLRNVGSYLATMGTAVAQVTWDNTSDMVEETLFNEVESKFAEEIFTKEEETGETEWSYDQDVRCRTLTPFHFTPDPGADEDPDHMSWCYAHWYEDIGWIRENYGQNEERTEAEGYFLKDDDEMQTQSGIEYPIFWWERLKDLIESPDGWTQFSSRLQKAGSGYAPNQTLMREWTCKPNPQFPRGRTIIQAGGHIIYSGISRGTVPPDENTGERKVSRWHQYSVCRFWTVPGRFWGMPLLSQLLAPQKRVNAIDSLQQLYREYATIGQWRYARQNNIQDGTLSGLSGSLIEYTAIPSGDKPEKMHPERMPPEVFAERNDVIAAIDRLSSAEGQLMAEAPSAVRSGVMMDQLQRKQRQNRSATLQDFEEFAVTVSRNIMIESALGMQGGMSQAFISQIQQAARDRSSMIAVATFASASLLDALNIELDLAASLLRSPEAKQQKAMEVFQYGGKTMDPGERAKVYEILGLDEFGSELSSDFARAKRMIAVITNGDVESMGFQGWQDIDEPSVFRQLLKSEIQSDRMVTYKPEVQQKLLMEYMMYKQAAEAKQMQQIQMQIMIQQAMGKGGGGETNSQESQSA